MSACLKTGPTPIDFKDLILSHEAKQICDPVVEGDRFCLDYQTGLLDRVGITTRLGSFNTGTHARVA
jgi:hypothetical protein